MRTKTTNRGALSGRILFTLTAILTLIAFTGCSGGGGGGTITPPITATITGDLQDGSGAPLSGYTVSFDHSTTLVATSNAQGQISLVVPVAAVTGTDTVTIKDTTGAVVLVEPVSVSTVATSTVPLGNVSLNAPPIPPSL